MPEITFSHPEVDATLGQLTITTGVNQIQWSYGLNTQTYPTYAGEVVQILSAYTDNLYVQGDCVSYSQMEKIYQWFLNYISVATQGKGTNNVNNSGSTFYNELPVTMTYPHRGWVLKIQPIRLPKMSYGRDIVIPTWELEAAVVEEEVEMTKLAQQQALLGDFGRLNAGIGYRPHNPFSSPDYRPEDIKAFLNGQTPPDETNLVDWYNSLIPSYTTGDFSAGILSPFSGKSPYSKPATSTAGAPGSATNPNDKTTVPGGKKQKGNFFNPPMAPPAAPPPFIRPIPTPNPYATGVPAAHDRQPSTPPIPRPSASGQVGTGVIIDGTFFPYFGAPFGRDPNHLSDHAYGHANNVLFDG